jgi:hypothetical protein
MTYRDEIIAEVWRNRDAYAGKHHHNLDEMVVDLQERQRKSGSKIVDRRKQTKTPQKEPFPKAGS